MRVICIEDNFYREAQEVYPLNKGNIYHVLSEHNVLDFKTKKGRKAENGIYYKLIETGDYAYHSSLFIAINEIEIDEMQLVNKNISELTQ